MNKSFSKIRHIQEANQRLEKRLMSEQTQTTVVQTGENPGVKTKTTPPMSNPTLPIPNSGETTTNPFKDQSLLNKYVGKQFQTYSMDMVSNPNDIERYRTGVFEISKVTPSISNVENRLIFDLGDAGKATYSCTNGGGDVIHILRTGESFGDFLKAPSFTKELKQNFCTTGSDGKIIAKVDYPTP